MMDFRQDTRHAIRLLRRAPGFTSVAIATLALGIGASTAIFSVIDAVLLRPLKFAEPQQLTMIRPTSGSRVSALYLDEWRRRSRAFADMAGWLDVRANLTGDGAPLEVLADRATTNFFAVLGTPALMGRTFTAGTNLGVVEPEVVLSYGLWQRRYGGDPRVVGRPITLDGEVYTIVGVMPVGFTIRTNELAESRAELWLPLRLVPGVRDGMGGFLNVVGRLAPGVTLEQGQIDLSLIAKRIEAEHPSNTPDWGVEVISLQAATVKDVRMTLLVLFGAVGILLLIACANVTNLILTRVAARQGEMAIRLSLGATGGRLVRQLLTESFVLTAIGGALGVFLAVWGTRLLVSFLPAGIELPRARDVAVNPRVLVIASLALIAITMFVGLVPWLNAVRSVPHSGLREANRGSSVRRGRNSVGSALIISEVALALVLLAGAALLGRSFWTLSRVNPGFRTEQVLTLRTTLPASGYQSRGRIRGFGADLLTRIRNLPGVRSVGFANYLPMSNVGIGGWFTIDGRPVPSGGERPSSWISVVGGDYFAAMGIPLLRGRFFSDADTELTPPVFIIDEALARHYWPGEDPIGKRVTYRRGGDDEREGADATGEIIGVVGSVRWVGMAANGPATTYWWFPQVPRRELTIVARAIGDPADMAGALAAQIREIDPNQPVSEIRAMRDFVSDDLARPRFTMLLLLSFAAAALLLAAIGLYGVIAFAVAQRTREIGVRVALGAQHRDVLSLVFRQGIVLTGAGIGIGVAAALALGRVMAGLVYGITPGDPITLVTVGGFLAVIAMLATYIPARRAARVDPMVALRTE